MRKVWENSQRTENIAGVAFGHVSINHSQREEEETSESPFKVGTGLFFVSQFSAQFRCYAARNRIIGELYYATAP